MSGIEIVQDCEVDYDGDVGGWLDVFWTEGHGHDSVEFIRAVVDHCLRQTWCLAARAAS